MKNKYHILEGLIFISVTLLLLFSSFLGLLDVLFNDGVEFQKYNLSDIILCSLGLVVGMSNLVLQDEFFKRVLKRIKKQEAKEKKDE